MKKYIAIIIVSALLLTALFILANKASQKSISENSPNNNKIGVAVSILPLSEFAEKIGADRIDISVMVPPGASPHTYEPIPSQLAKVEKAKAYIKVGTPVEFEIAWMDKILSLNPDMIIIDSSKNIELIDAAEDEHHDHSDHGADPHIWLSPKNAMIMVENIYKGLSKSDPENQNYYLTNKNKYLKKLEALDSEITRKVKELRNKKFMVFHPSWSYFAKDYGLVQVPIEIDGKEPSPRDLARLIKKANEENISVIIASPELNSESATIIAKETQAEVILISSLEKNYIENMEKIIEALDYNN